MLRGAEVGELRDSPTDRLPEASPGMGRSIEGGYAMDGEKARPKRDETREDPSVMSQEVARVCRRARDLMPIPDEGLQSHEIAWLAAHLRGCRACRIYRESVTDLQGLLSELALLGFEAFIWSERDPRAWALLQGRGP